MQRKIIFSPQEYYHVYNRGNSKQKIFLNVADHWRFIKLLFACNSKMGLDMQDVSKDILDFSRGEPIVDIGAYCLMPNHFHLLIRETNKPCISIFMKKISTAYAMYFNKKYSRTGSLFEGRFKAEHANNDRYLKYLFAYIHLNPVKLRQPNWKEDGIKNVRETLTFLETYPYSSFHSFVGKKNVFSNHVINTEAFPEYFSSHQEFYDEIVSWFSKYGKEK